MPALENNCCGVERRSSYFFCQVGGGWYETFL